MALRQAGCQSSGKYTLTSGFEVFCRMDIAGGGWQLLLTQTHAMTQYSGSTSPLIKDLNPNNPNPSNPYSRNWNGKITPNGNDEFLLTSSADDDWVRFVTS